MIDASLKNANILIVDDQIANIDVLEGLLDAQGYTTIKSTTDSRQVVQLFTDFKPDLVLLDLTMPHLTGFDVMKQLKPLIPANSFLPILVLTADVTPEAKQKALSGGASDFLTKPFDLIEVGLRIKNLLFASYLQQQLQNQNLSLEEKVKERTSELEKTNLELMVARDKAEASNRLKTAFMQNISHEVRTPLNGILGFGNLLADMDISAEEKQEFIPMLQYSSERLVNTITDYMDISLIASGTMEVKCKQVSIAGELYQLKDKFYSQCTAKKLAFNLFVPEKIKNLTINTDPELFSKMISHLIGNAIKFTTNGVIDVGLDVESDFVEIYIKDTGIGIEKDSHELIFESFAQEDASNTRGHEGSGLGLSIVKGLIGLLGGNIRFESEKGHGSVFYVKLPLVSEVANVQEITTTGKPILQKPLVVLIAEDDYSSRKYLEIVLSKYTSNLFYAGTGVEAIVECRKHPNINLVLMDIKMPEMNGLDATRIIKATRRDLPVIAITAYAMSGDEKKALDAGCDDYLPKPLSSSKLINKLIKLGFIS